MLALLAPGSVVGGGGAAASTFSSLPRIICCFPKPMPLKCMYRCSCCSVWNVIYPYFWFDRSFGFTVTFLFSSTNFPFFLFFRPFLFNFVEPSSVRKKHAYTHVYTYTHERTIRRMNKKKYLQRCFPSCSQSSPVSFHLSAKTKFLLLSHVPSVAVFVCSFFTSLLLFVCGLLLLVVVMVLQPFEQKRQIALIIYVVQRTTRDWKSNLFP